MNLVDTLDSFGGLFIGVPVVAYGLYTLAKNFTAEKNEKYFVDEEILKEDMKE